MLKQFVLIAGLTPITYSITGSGTGASITSGSLPTGVSGTYNTGTKTFTINGTPTVTGIFNYTITATGMCASITISGTITVQSDTIVLTSGTASPTLCLGSTLTNIVYTVGGGATSANASISWSPSTPSGISAVPTSGNTFTISGTPGALGTYNYTITTTDGCTPAASVTGTITVNNGSVGGTLTPSVPAICSGGGGSLIWLAKLVTWCIGKVLLTGALPGRILPIPPQL